MTSHGEKESRYEPSVKKLCHGRKLRNENAKELAPYSKYTTDVLGAGEMLMRSSGNTLTLLEGGDIREILQVLLLIILPIIREYDEQVLTHLTLARCVNSVVEFMFCVVTPDSGLRLFVYMFFLVYSDILSINWTFVFAKNLYDKIVSFPTPAHPKWIKVYLLTFVRTGRELIPALKSFTIDQALSIVIPIRLQPNFNSASDVKCDFALISNSTPGLALDFNCSPALAMQCRFHSRFKSPFRSNFRSRTRS
ncbi:hypothetical protein EVAR_50246_1 [Eumeta japonica]|uniref:Uncharacterized protein n=1 Tax=Eumeta variegata TaxID=151549 RepID=A0A4C1YGR1_EUMVA|nr:hypothetical protein EVAR_50246_1 [Eumeta japonica]